MFFSFLPDKDDEDDEDDDGDDLLHIFRDGVSSKKIIWVN